MTHSPLFEKLMQQLNYQPKDEGLIHLALTHKSYYNENKASSSGCNERLEFLGDAVLDLVIGHLLMTAGPEDSEGVLSKKRASLVNEDTLCKLALELGLDQLLRLGKGEIKSASHTNQRLLASTFEALIGGIYLDSNYDQIFLMVQRLFFRRMEDLRDHQDMMSDFKTRLQERIQKKFQQTPMYRAEEAPSAEGERLFRAEVFRGEILLAFGVGKTKKAAEQEAAKKAFEQEMEQDNGAN